MIEITTRPWLSLQAIAAIANVPESYVEDDESVVVEKWEKLGKTRMSRKLPSGKLT